MLWDSFKRCAMKANVDKYQQDRQFPWEVVLSAGSQFFAELLSRRRALKERVSDLENMVKLLQFELEEIKKK